MTILHASRNIESVRPLSNDERRAAWASRYYLQGLHHQFTPARSGAVPPCTALPTPQDAAALAPIKEIAA